MLDKIDQLAALLAEDEPERLEELKGFWQDWFNHRIKGDKHTIIHEKDGRVVGVVRLWKTPHLDIGYLVEGLEVSSAYRRQGIGKQMLLEAIDYMKTIGEDYLYSGTYEKNYPSINTHLSAGFDYDDREKRNSHGTLQTYTVCFKIKLR